MRVSPLPRRLLPIRWVSLPLRRPVRGISDGAGLDGDRFLRGTLSHALLEHLPGIDPSRRATAAAAYLEARAGHLPERTRRSIAKEVLAIVNDPAFGALFAAGSRAEVPIVAEIPQPSGRGPALKLTGRSTGWR